MGADVDRNGACREVLGGGLCKLFGSVTFFLFHRDGYAALRLLDDNGDGEGVLHHPRGLPAACCLLHFCLRLARNARASSGESDTVSGCSSAWSFTSTVAALLMTMGS
jgi:hypothetical protein